MDIDKLAALVAKKHGVRFDSYDPLFVLVTLVEEMQRQNTAETSKIVTDGADQIGALVAQAGDTIGRQMTHASEIATERAAAAIRHASQDAVDHFIEIVEVQVRRSDRAAMIAMMGAFVSIAAATLATVPLWAPLMSRVLG